MSSFVSKLLANKLTDAKEALQSRINDLVDEKISQVKLRLVDEMFGHIEYDIEEEIVSEGNIQKMGRTKMIRVRIRGGKVQRRVKKSAVKGFTIRGGKLVRMSPQEKRNRKMAARRAKFKRRAKMKQAIRKRQRSLRRRKAMGL